MHIMQPSQRQAVHASGRTVSLSMNKSAGFHGQVHKDFKAMKYNIWHILIQAVSILHL